MWLPEKDKKYLNDIYAKAHKKYFAWTVPVSGGKPLSYAEALAAAREELESFYATRRTEIFAKHNAKILGINTEANKRGLITSTIVLQQIERAEQERDLALSKFETVTDAKVRIAARKIMADELGRTRLSVQADKEALKFALERTKVGGIPVADLQKALDEEVYAEYLRFLLALSPDVALAYVDNDPLFFYNLSAIYFNKLKAEMAKRGW